MPIVPQTRTPFGGMNQDDSLVTPSKDAAGKNMFEVGDYRYALNARIGSSRSDHFGDLENIRNTVEVTEYYAAQQIFQNTSFEGSLDNWDQLDESVDYIPWIYNENAARLTLTPDAGSSEDFPEYVASSAKVSASGTSGVPETIDVAYPAGIQAGDLLIIVATLIQTGGSVGSITIIPSGWDSNNNTFPDSTLVYAGNVNIYRKIATGSESGTIELEGTCNANYSVHAKMFAIRSSAGVSLEDVDVNTTGNGASTISWNATTVGGTHRTLLAFAVGNMGVVPAPSGYTSETNDGEIRFFSKEDVSSDGSVTTSGGDSAGWATVHMSILAPGYSATPFISEVIYQTTTAPIGGGDVSIQFDLEITGAITSGTVKLVCLDGTSIISEETIAAGTITSMVYNETHTLPANCDGIGVRVSGTIATPSTADLLYFQALGTFFAPSTRPAGNEKVIGRYEDYEFQRLYYCVWNDEGNHCIRYWDAVNNYIVEVLQWEGLNWLSTTFVKMSKLDNWMAFTDKRNPPRLIDVDTIASLKAELADEFREFHISFHKWAPTVPPIPRIYYDGSTNNFDKLKDKVFHFAYRYIYEGNLKSRWSPISKGATVIRLLSTFYANESITAIEVDIPGALLDDPSDTATEYNYFDHTDIKFTSVVKSIELAFRDGELELWKLWKRVEVNPSFNRLQYFDGNGLLTPVSQDEFNQVFDTVPFLAGTVEAIDNRFVFGDILDEKPPVENWEVTDVSSGEGLDQWQDQRTSSFAAMSATPRANLQRLNALSKLTFKDRCFYKVGIQFLYPTGWRTGIYTSEEWLYNVPDIGGNSSGSENISFNFKIPDHIIPPEGAVGYQIMRTNALNISYYLFGIVNKMTPIIDDVSDVTDQLSLPQNVKDKITEHFRNVQNISGDEVIAFTQKALQEEIDANAPRDRKIRRRNRQLRRNTIFNFANSGVGHGLTTLAIEKWGKRTPVGPILERELRKTKTISTIADASRIHIDINNWIFGAKKGTNQEFPLNKLFYNFTEGDRVRFVGSDLASPTNDDLKEYDVPIIEFTGKGLIIERPESLQWISIPTVLSPRNHNIEVYTPHIASFQDHIFYEMGEWYPVLFPGQSNRDFAKRDFIWTDQASVTLSQYGPFDIFHKMPIFYGDSYSVGKTIYRDDVEVGWVGANSSPMFISMNPDINKTYDYWDKNNGRAAIAYEELPVERFKPTMARFGGKIIEESFVNNLNNMREEDNFIYPSEYGRIRDLVNTANAQVESVGSILLAIGEREAWSIYVNRTTLEDLSGRSQVALSEDVLGSFNTLLGSHGTLNPESVCKNRGRVWWWNAIKGSWLRYGRDGLTEISEYKMRNWFSELGDLMITKYQSAELPLAIAEFDPFNRELVTFQDHSTLPATFRGYSHYKGTLFSEDDTRWKSCHNFQPEMMGKINNQLIMFKNGSPFLYEKGTAYSAFFGVKYNVMWEPVFNDEPQLKKAWKALAVVSTDGWSVERILGDYRGLKIKQQTRIKLGDFEIKEDNYYASIGGDLNTPHITDPVVNGDLIRSKAIQVLMQLDPAIVHLSLLHYVMAEITDSPKNP